MPACKTCEAENRDEQEETALEAVNNRISWREAARKLGLGHHQSLKNHMERHFAGLLSLDPTEQVAYLIEENIKELQEQLALAPPEIKPFFFMIIHNLRGLAGTKPSQQALNASLKAIHEVVGMKTQNRLMMDFAMAAFKKQSAEEELLPRRADYYVTAPEESEAQLPSGSAFVPQNGTNYELREVG